MDTHNSNSRVRTAWSLVKVPAILTLVVTIVRLIGELQGWNETWFGTGVGEPGPDGKARIPGMFGIVWLVPIFGAYFGMRIRNTVGGPRLGPAIGMFVVANLVVVGGMFALISAGIMVLPDPKAPKDPEGLGWALLVMAVGLTIAFFAWRRLAWTLVLYGVLARIPVILVTGVAVGMDWKTHHTKLPAGVPAKEGMEKLLALAAPQATIWIIFTVLIGGLIGAIASSFAGNAKAGRD